MRLAPFLYSCANIHWHGKDPAAVASRVERLHLYCLQLIAACSQVGLKGYYSFSRSVPSLESSRSCVQDLHPRFDRNYHLCKSSLIFSTLHVYLIGA